MRALLLVVMVLGLAGYAHAQEAGYATFLEIAQIVVDRAITHDVTASITLQSVSTEEITVPQDLEEAIRNDGRIRAVLMTNEDACVLGVVDRACILINVERDPADRGINAIQNSTQAIGDAYISEINRALGTDAKFHSVFIHSGTAGGGLAASGPIVGRNIISAVYTMFQEDTGQLYSRVTDGLLAQEIRDGGGFYDVGKELAGREGAVMALSIIPLEGQSLLQIKVSSAYRGAANTTSVSPSDYLGGELSRSGYYSGGFYPLNSVVQAVVLSSENESVYGVRGGEIPSEIVDGERVPTDVTASGWIFDPGEGQQIQAKYLFGTAGSAAGIGFELGEEESQDHVIVWIIAAVATAAALYYLRGYKRSQ